VKQYLMIKCLNCGHSFKSAVDTVRTRCSKCGKSKLIQVSAIEESVISDVELLKKRANTLENFIQNNMQASGITKPTRTHTPKPELKAEVKQEPKSTSTPYTTSPESTPDIELDSGPEPEEKLTHAQKFGLMIGMDEEEIIEVFTNLMERLDALEKENKELKEMIVSNNERHESIESAISAAITDHAGWIQIFKEMFSSLSGQYDKKKRIIKLFDKDDSFWIHWNRNRDREIIHDISETPHDK